MWPRPSLAVKIAATTSCALLLLLGGAVAQEPAAPEPPADAPAEPPEGGEAARVPAKTNYRFRETHGASAPHEIAKIGPQYRVAIRETVTTEVAKAKGAKEAPRSATRTAIWTERVAALDPFYKDVVTAVVRQYEAAPKGGTDPGAPPLEGLNLWVQYRAGQPPLLLNLGGGRELTDQDYRWIATQPFPPQVSSLLPMLPQRVGDSWRISPSGVEALLQVPVEYSDLNAKFLAVKAAEGEIAGRLIAEFAIAGKAVRIDGGEVALNARMEFEFTPAQVHAVDSTELMNAYGAVTRLSLGLSQSMPGPRRGDPATIIKRQLTLERKVTGDAPSLETPATPPVPTIENSWLVFDNPKGGWRIRHPQDFQVQGNPETGGVDLVAHREAGAEVISLKPEAKGKLDPEALRRDRIDRWKKENMVAKPGALSNLAPNQWPGVAAPSRFQATITPGSRGRDAEDAPPINFWGYILNYTDPPMGLYAEVMSVDPEPEAFAKEAEMILRTFQPGAGRGEEPAAAPAARRGGTNPQTQPLSLPSGPTETPDRSPVVEPPLP